jgi:hypothetical protein
LNTHRKLRRTTHLCQSLTVAPHFAVIAEPSQSVLQNSRRVRIRRFNNAVVHPGALPPRSNNSGPAQIRQMPADLWLISLEDLYEETNAYFILTHEMKQSQSSSVGQGAKE